MQNINFNDGYISMTINNDPNRVISFNPSDFGMIDRYYKSVETIEKLTEEISDFKLNSDGTPKEQLGEAAAAVERLSNAIKEQIDFIFNNNVSEVVFGKQSPLSIVGGAPLWERFLLAITPVVEREAKREKRESIKRISKYTKQVVK